MRRGSAVVLAALGVAFAACDGSKVDETPAPPAIVPHDAPAPAADDAPPPATTSVVRVRLAAGSPFQGPLYASLHRVDDPTVGRRRVGVARAPFSSDLVATLTAPDPGRYAVELEVETMAADVAPPGVLGSGASVKRRSRLPTVPADPVVTVGDDGAPVEVVVAIAPDDE